MGRDGKTVVKEPANAYKGDRVPAMLERNNRKKLINLGLTSVKLLKIEALHGSNRSESFLRPSMGSKTGLQLY